MDKMIGSHSFHSMYFYHALASVRKTQLNYERDFDFLLAGLVTPLPDYRIGWHLNRQLGIRLIKKEDLVPSGSLSPVGFSCFLCEQPITHSVFYLIQNKFNGALFANEWKKVDYFLMIRGSWFMERVESVFQQIRVIDDVQAVIAIDPKTIKNKDLFQI
jgi:hypothetical protein